MSALRARLAPLFVAALLAGCGGGGGGLRNSRDNADDYAGDYTGSYSLASNTLGTPDGAIVLDVDANGEAQGSVTVSGTVYDFTGRINNGGVLSGRGSGLVVYATLGLTDSGTVRTLAGKLILTGAVQISNATATLTRVEAAS